MKASVTAPETLSPPDVVDDARMRASTPDWFSALTSRLPVVDSTVERRTLASAPPRTTLVAAMPLAAMSVPPPAPPLVPAVPVFDWKEVPPEDVTVLRRVAEMSAASAAWTVKSRAEVTVASVMRAPAPPVTSLNTIRPPKALDDEPGVRAVGIGSVEPAAGAGAAGGLATVSSFGMTVLAAAGSQFALV